jgi:biopolymer transport protein ExbD
MRRFSQRNSLVTLSDINVTPLLDLAFVLLIIFIIISPSIRSNKENALDLNLPKGGGPEPKLKQSDIRSVEISPQGVYMLDRKRMTLDQLESRLVQAFRDNPNSVVWIRADENGRYRDVYALIDRCRRQGITRFSLAGEGAK